MKLLGTAVIRLQNFDNIDSVLDKLRQVLNAENRPSRVLMIWPLRGNVLENSTEYSRVRAYVRNAGSQIAFVTANEIVRKISAEQDIPVFASQTEAETVSWSVRKDRDRDERMSRLQHLISLREEMELSREKPVGRGIEILFFLLALAAVAFSLFFLIPSAEVRIAPELITKSEEFTLWTAENLPAMTLSGGIPSKEYHFSIPVSVTVPTMGILQTQGALALGTIVVKNTCDSRKTAPAGIEVYTQDGIAFRTMDEVSLEPHEAAELRIEALSSGSEANLPAWSIVSAEYPHSICLEVSQYSPTEGGTDGISHLTTEADRDTAAAQIALAAVDELKKNEEYISLTGSAFPLESLITAHVTSETLTPGLDYVSDSLTLEQILDVTVPAVGKKDADHLVEMMVTCVDDKAENISYHFTDDPVQSDDRISRRLTAEWQTLSIETNEDAVRKILKGKTLAAGRTILDQISPNRTPEIRLFPEWLGIFPVWEQRISVIITNGSEQ